MSDAKEGIILFSAVIIYAWLIAWVGTQIYCIFDMPIYKFLTVFTCILLFFALMIVTVVKVTKTNP